MANIIIKGCRRTQNTLGDRRRKALSILEDGGAFKDRKMLEIMGMTEAQAKRYWDKDMLKCPAAEKGVDDNHN